MVDTRTKTISLEVVDKLREELRSMPVYVPTHVSKQRAVAMLAECIAGMRQKGFPWNLIAAWLTDNGLVVSASALRTYVRRISPQPASTQHQATKNPARVTRGAPAVHLVAVGERPPRDPNDR